VGRVPRLGNPSAPGLRLPPSPPTEEKLSHMTKDDVLLGYASSCSRRQRERASRPLVYVQRNHCSRLSGGLRGADGTQERAKRDVSPRRWRAAPVRAGRHPGGYAGSRPKSFGRPSRVWMISAPVLRASLGVVGKPSRRGGPSFGRLLHHRQHEPQDDPSAANPSNPAAATTPDHDQTSRSSGTYLDGLTRRTAPPLRNSHRLERLQMLTGAEGAKRSC
jgi:hypothetical protein